MMTRRPRDKREVFEVSGCGHPNFMDVAQVLSATGLLWSELQSHIRAGRLVPKSPPGDPIQEFFHVEDVAALVGK